jgi:hypothetical protein
MQSTSNGSPWSDQWVPDFLSPIVCPKMPDRSSECSPLSILGHRIEADALNRDRARHSKECCSRSIRICPSDDRAPKRRDIRMGIDALAP